MKTLNQKIMANYVASMELAGMKRERLKELSASSFDIGIRVVRKQLINEARELLQNAKVLRINALYFTEVKS